MFGLGSNPIPLTLVAQLGTYLKLGMDHYADLRNAGKAASPETLTAFLSEKMENWDPKVKDKSLLDKPTRQAGARFLAGIACNLTGA